MLAPQSLKRSLKCHCLLLLQGNHALPALFHNGEAAAGFQVYVLEAEHVSFPVCPKLQFLKGSPIEISRREV